MNIQLQYQNLQAHEKVIYLDVATNPALQQLLLNQKEALEAQILDLNYLSTESAEDFVLRYQLLVVRLKDIKAFIELNKEVVKSHMQQIKMRN